MNGVYHSLYNLTITLISFPLLPLLGVYFLLKPEHAKGFSMRLGKAPETSGRRGKQARVWIHASSVGEVNVAEAIIKAFSEERSVSFTLSTFTWDGFKHARERFGKQAHTLILPLDFKWCVRRALQTVRPDVYVTLETELWPNFLMTAHEFGIKTMLANGRLSPKSVKRFRTFRPFFKEVFRSFDILSMAGPKNSERVIALGAPADRVKTNVNAKFGLLARRAESLNEEKGKIRKNLGLDAKTNVFVAGSVRKGEETDIAEVCARLHALAPKTVSLVAPRHMKRIPLFGAALKKYGLEIQNWSRIRRGEKRSAQVVLVDTLGDLFVMYGVATVAFCGASLVDLGGQNIMEPAAWGVAPMHGPYIDDFIDAAEMLAECEASVQVNSANELFEKLVWLIDNGDARAEMGRRALKVVKSHERAAEETARLIRRLLPAQYKT